jgi:hypothetical protein
VLRPDGIGTADFGTAGGDALMVLTELFGAPDRELAVDPERVECVEGSAWSDCVPVVRHARIVGWVALGLDVLLTDYGPDGRQQAEHFGSWHAVAGRGATTLATVDGLAPGDLVGEARRLYPNVRFFANEGVGDSFWIETPTGTYAGALAWASREVYVRALQQTLNANGADLVVDGVPGPNTEQACLDLASVLGIEEVGCLDAWMTTEMVEAFGFPPDETEIHSLEAVQR